MKVRAVIITHSPKPHEQGYLPGVKYDALQWVRYLLSVTGGAWHPNEIIILKSPTLEQVIATMQGLKADYVFCAFSGHGVIDTKSGKRYLLIRNKEWCCVENLTATGSKRQFVIVDLCGTYANLRLTDPDALIGDPELWRKTMTHGQARMMFRRWIAKCPNGWTLITSSAPGQYSYDTGNGGLFTRALVAMANKWGAANSKGSILTSRGAHALAYRTVKKIQSPTIIHSRPDLQYLFAIRPQY